MIDLDHLEHLARAATPGPWEATELVVHPSFKAPNQPRVTSGGRDVARMAVGGHDDVVAATFCTIGKYEHEKRNADYLAALSPDVVLALVTELRAARDGLRYGERVIAELVAARDELLAQLLAQAAGNS